MSNKTDENIEKLAKDIVEAWDMDSLLEYAVDMLVRDFSLVPEEDFDEEWNTFYGENEDE